MRMDTLDTLEATIRARRTRDPDASYVARLTAKGRGKIAQKLGEEAVETVIAAMSNEREEVVKQQLKDAQAQWEVVRQSENKDTKKAAVLARNKAQAALREHEQEARDQFSSLHLFVHYWAQGKEENRRAWAQAMNAVVTGGSGSVRFSSRRFRRKLSMCLRR